MTHDQLAS